MSPEQTQVMDNDPISLNSELAGAIRDLASSQQQSEPIGQLWKAVISIGATLAAAAIIAVFGLLIKYGVFSTEHENMKKEIPALGKRVYVLEASDKVFHTELRHMKAQSDTIDSNVKELLRRQP